MAVIENLHRKVGLWPLVSGSWFLVFDLFAVSCCRSPVNEPYSSAAKDQKTKDRFSDKKSGHEGRL
jgi:hypothetical protein